MKRQRGVNVNGATIRPMNNSNDPPNVEEVAPMVGKKRVKKEGELKVVKSVVEEEERKESRDMLVGGNMQHQQQGARDGAMMGWNWEENNQNMLWLGVGNVVDEQMSWGSNWFPSWDMDFLGGEAFTALYNDVVWDEDIWNLNNQIPIPLDRKEV